MVPGAIDVFAGAIAIDTSPGATARLKEPETAPTFAVIAQLPLFLAVSIPPADTEETLASDEFHTALLVRS